jgi:hypothetical protein
MGKLTVHSREAALWFSQPMMPGADLSSDEEGQSDDHKVDKCCSRRKLM